MPCVPQLDRGPSQLTSEQWQNVGREKDEEDVTWVNGPQSDTCTTVCSRRAMGLGMPAQGPRGMVYATLVQQRQCLFLERLKGAQKRDRAATLNVGESSWRYECPYAVTATFSKVWNSLKLKQWREILSGRRAVVDLSGDPAPSGPSVL